MANPRIALNLTPEDHKRLNAAKAAFQKRTGVTTIPTTEALRLAIKAFAEKEGVK